MKKSTSNLIAVLIVLFVVIVGVTGIVGNLDFENVSGGVGGDITTTTTTAVASTTAPNSGSGSATTTTKTPAVTTAPVACAHPEHTKAETPVCSGCQVTVTHNYGEATYVAATSGANHTKKQVCSVCLYEKSTSEVCTYEDGVCEKCKKACEHDFSGQDVIDIAGCRLCDIQCLHNSEFLYVSYYPVTSTTHSIELVCSFCQNITYGESECYFESDTYCDCGNHQHSYGTDGKCVCGVYNEDYDEESNTTAGGADSSDAGNSCSHSQTTIGNYVKIDEEKHSYSIICELCWTRADDDKEESHSYVDGECVCGDTDGHTCDSLQSCAECGTDEGCSVCHFAICSDSECSEYGKEVCASTHSHYYD